MSPAEKQEMVSTPMLGSGLRWNSGASAIRMQPSSSSPNHQQQRGHSRRNSGGSRSQFITPRNEDEEFFNNLQQQQGGSGATSGNRRYNNNNTNDDILFSSRQEVGGGGGRTSAPNSGLRRSTNPPDAFGPPSNNNNNNNYNYREQHSYRGDASGIRPVNFIDGLEDGGEQVPSSTRSSSLAFPQQQPVSLMTSPAMSRLRTSTSGNYVPASPSKNGGNGILKLETLRSPGANSDSASTVNQGWRDNYPAVTSGAGPNGSNIMWTNNRKNML